MILMKSTRIKQTFIRLCKDLKNYVFLFFVAILLAAGMRVFLFASFKIPSPSMESKN
jgi:signal peptidase I